MMFSVLQMAQPSSASSAPVLQLLNLSAVVPIMLCCRPPMQLLYNLELGFYISSIFMIVHWEVKRKDFLAMFSHHIVTVILISASMYFR